MSIDVDISDLANEFADFDDDGFHFKEHMLLKFAKQFALDVLYDKSLQDELFEEYPE